jgi:hypothetical protein
MMSKPYYIDYPQEHVEGAQFRYRCAFCKLETTKINGRLEGHLPDCEYRQAREKNQTAGIAA